MHINVFIVTFCQHIIHCNLLSALIFSYQMYNNLKLEVQRESTYKFCYWTGETRKLQLFAVNTCLPCSVCKMMAPSMMKSSNGNIFRVTSPLCGEFTGPGEFPTQRPVTWSFNVFFDLRLNKRLSKQPWGHRGHYDVKCNEGCESIVSSTLGYTIGLIIDRHFIMVPQPRQIYYSLHYSISNWMLFCYNKPSHFIIRFILSKIHNNNE